MIPATIVHAFITAAERTPEQPCILFEGQTYSYARLYLAAQGWAGGMQAWGLQPGDRVALYLENSPLFLAAYLGIHLAGGTVVLINTQYRQVELRHIMNDAGVRLCVTDGQRYPELRRSADELPTLEAVVLAEAPDAAPAATEANQPANGFVPYPAATFVTPIPKQHLTMPQPDDIAIIAYTSGTTGRAKGAMLLHRNLVANSLAVTSAWHWTAQDHLLLVLPLFHVHGLCVGMHGTFITGASVELRRRFDAAEVYTTLLQGEITMFFGVPTMYTRLIAVAQQEPQRPQPIRLFVSGSAPLDPQTFAEFEQLFGQRILERYGMTETIMNLTNPYDGERRPGTVGQPFPGQEARIVDVTTRQPVADETPGEIQVRGPHVFKGYWNRPDATAEVFDNEGWFSTGDLGWRSSDGYFTIAGRARELIISGGYNIYPREVEEVLLTHPAIAEAAVLGLPDPDMGEQVVAVLVRTPSASTGDNAHLEEEVIALCRDQLAAYKKPRRIIFTDTLPRNALGKVQKHLLKEQLAGGG